MTADHPEVITNPGVKADIDRESRESYEVKLMFALFCQRSTDLPEGRQRGCRAPWRA
jgi:hypothetical protein